MGYFPFFMNISGQPALIAGGGTVALRKIEKLQPFSPELKVVAPEICPEIREIPGLQLVEREYRPGDEEGMMFVIAATDDRKVNRLIHERCTAASIPINAVDDAELCSFIFPALVSRGKLSVGISTGGSSPTAAICLKEKINELLPENFEEILDYLNEKRQLVKKLVPEGKARQAALKALFYACMAEGRTLSEGETAELIKGEADRCGK